MAIRIMAVRYGFRYVSLVMLLILPAGCKQLDDWRQSVQQRRGSRGGEPIPQVSAEQLVHYLNQQASRLRTLSYAEARMTAREGEGLKGAVSYTLRGRLAAAQPRYFHLSAQGGLAGGKVDLGSNDERFWIYIDAPGNKPLYVYATHADFAAGKVQLPGNLPFEPDWVLQALGMTTFLPTAPYEAVRIDERHRTYTLSWAATTPSGQSIRKEIVFAVDTAVGSRPQVLRHLIRNPQGKTICSAEIKSAHTFPTGSVDPQSGHPHIVQCPNHVVLRWEEQKVEIDLRLEDARINQPWTAEQMRAEFTPRISGAVPINLAEARFPGEPGRP
ncbi:MAG: hypothetical protein WHU94_08060 [Thermogemmata sp.]|uniref:Outer membrane lipoprotein-sorting protein n=1 Tax=Thermogemmata fonticola TaxID=2755323 RepID=A0A7V9AB68_9BACT|nr:hypothetical protein [Thermogemmata fonticola]MBA2225906.1 hypothetical protein [Thermogemmata fonticola]MCX8138460.1 hypothetical protein [Gemmataceae bacterium]